MGKSITIELPDEVYAVLHEIEQATGRPLAELASEWLLRLAPKTQPLSDEAELRDAWDRLLRHAGAANSGDPDSSDNDRIDADLAREYASTHENTD